MEFVFNKATLLCPQNLVSTNIWVASNQPRRIHASPYDPTYETLQARSMSRVVFLFEGLEDAEKLTKAVGLGWLVKGDLPGTPKDMGPPFMVSGTHTSLPYL